VILAAIAMSAPLAAQDFTTPGPEKGRITGTVIDPNNGIVAGATTVLEGPGSVNREAEVPARS